MNNFGSKRNLRKSFVGIFSLLLIAGLLVFLQSCTKEHFNLDKLKDPTWNPTFAVPLVSSTLTVQDILDNTDDDSVIVIDQSTGLLALIYTSEIFSLEAQEFFQLPDFNAGGGPPITPGQATDYTTNGSVTIALPPIALDIGPTLNSVGASLNTIEFKAGNIELFANGNVSAPAEVTVSINNLTNGGTAFSHTCNFPNNPVSQACLSNSLSGFTLDMSGGSNIINVGVSITYQSGGSLVPGQVNNYEVRFRNLEYSLITGDLGQVSFNTGRDSVSLGIFDNTDDGTLFYEDPSFFLRFENSIGAEVRMDVATFDAVSPANGTVSITGLSQVNVLAPNTPGNTALTQVVLDNNNSNIKNAINISPRYIVYDVSSLSNPAGTPANNFILDTSRVRLEGEINLPFWGRAEDFTKASDTIDFEPDSLVYSADSGYARGELVSVTMRFNFNNGFPAEGFGQVYFLKDNGVLVDSLIENPQEGLFASGQTNANGDVTAKVLTTTDIVLSAEKLEFLKANQARKLYATGTVETTNQGQDVIRIYEDYTLDLDLGMKIEFKATVELDSLRNNN